MLRAIELSLKIGILITDTSSKILYVNSMVSYLTGYSEEELLGKVVPYPFWAENTPLPSEVLSTGHLTEEDFPYQFDFDIIRKDGETLKGALLASPFYSTNMLRIGWIYLIRDNTFDFKAQTLINDVISSYQKLLDSVQSAISVVTHKPSGNILGIRNSTYKRELGATVHGHEVISKAFKEPFNPEGLRNGDVWVESLAKWFSVTESRVTLPGGSHVTLQLALDITDKKEAEKTVAEQSTKLENSSRLVTLGEMASTITHEINQPLTAILAYANTAIEVMGSAPQINKNQALEIYKKIATQASRIDKIIKNIRSFAKRRSTLLEVTPLNTIFTDITELGMLIEKKYPGIKVVCDKPRKMPEVMCDPVQIVQILMNLIRNAAEAITESGAKDKTVTVSAVQHGDMVKMSVSDHGPGISDTIKASLFTPFFSTKKTGLGLGLSTCKTIAESHNTRLNIQDNVDSGTIFSFELKVANPK
ncbi:MAG: ATP-binding protein [Burkholderiales bacterium]|nr:ATP-binding protein [Burkholderiales bacterium]